jgi:hypothetical protein
MAKVRRYLVSLADAGGDEVAAYVNFGGSNAGRAEAVEASTIGQKRKMTMKSFGTADDVSNKSIKKQRVPILKADGTSVTTTMVDMHATYDIEKENIGIGDDNSENVRVLSHALFGSEMIVASRSSSNLIPVNGTEAMVPYDPLCNGDWSMSTGLEREIAWLTEENRLLIPVNDYPKHLLPLALNFVRAHGSTELGEKMKIHHSNAADENSLAVVDGYILLLHGRPNGNGTFNHGVFSRLRKQAHDALRLGYRRTESIKMALLGARQKTISGKKKVRISISVP